MRIGLHLYLVIEDGLPVCIEQREPHTTAPIDVYDLAMLPPAIIARAVKVASDSLGYKVINW